MGPRRPPTFYVIAPAALSLLGAGSAGAGTSCNTCVSPPPPPPAPCGCAPTTHQVKVPGVSITTPQINIGLPSIGVGSGSGSASGVGTATASAGSFTSVSVSTSSSGGSTSSNNNLAALLGSSGGGGSGSWTPEGGVSTEIGEMKVEMLQAPLPVPPPVVQQICIAWKTEVRQVAIQAVCLDDKAVPHPASQVSPERAVAAGYEGEVFRCIAGARMQYTVANFAGQADFNHGQTIVCQKGEALYHSAAGALQCRPQTPARDCNERSLLRRFGAGIKIMSLGGAQVCTAYRPQTVAAAPVTAPAGPVVLN